MEPFIIRTASINDAKAIAECHKEAVEKKAAIFYGANIINEWSWSSDRIEKILGAIDMMGANINGYMGDLSTFEDALHAAIDEMSAPFRSAPDISASKGHPKKHAYN